MVKKILGMLLLLAAGIVASHNSGSFDSSAVEGDGGEPEPTSTYRVDADDLSLTWQTGGETQAADSATWRAVVALLPNATLKAEVTEYHVFTDGEDETLAYVSQLEDDWSKWLFAVDSVDAINKESKSFVTTVTHEFAHILALENDQVTPGVEQADCAQDYWMEEGCPIASAHVLAYFEQFWKGALYSEHQQMIAGLDGEDKDDAVADFYDAHLEKFINEYSATDPIEDFAETFSYFVFVDQIGSPMQMREQKINYFYSVPSFVAVRDHIRAQTSIRRDDIDDQSLMKW